MSQLVIGLMLFGVVLTVSALASGIVERAPLSFPMIFLGLGLLLGDGALGVLPLSTHNIALEAVATVSLSLVLFLDAISMKIDEVREDWLVPVLSLGPGSLLTIGGVALAAHALVGTTWIQSLLLGAILSSTDPVVLRDIVRDERIPRSVRRALGVESGMNDIVVLPIVLVLIAILQAEASGVMNWAIFLVQLLVFSPVIGMVVGGFGSLLINQADRRFGIRREYQALYGIGLVLLSYVAGQAVQGDGFLAAFFAGLAVSLFNIDLCDCFLEYGETTSEMMMLLAFILFGAVLSALFTTMPLLLPLVFALIAICVVRPVAMGVVLRRANMSTVARVFIGWFGPRGLNSLLLALLVVQSGAPQAEHLLTITGVVVLVSVLLHGVSATPLSAWYGRKVAAETLDEEREGSLVGLFARDAQGESRITVAELVALLDGPEPPLVLDVRTRSQYDASPDHIPGSVRVLPDQVEDWARDQDRKRAVVAYCT